MFVATLPCNWSCVRISFGTPSGRSVYLHISLSIRKLLGHRAPGKILLLPPVPLKGRSVRGLDRSGVQIGSSVDAVLFCGGGKRALIDLRVKRLFQRMMQRGVGSAHLFLPLISIATLWCVVYAQGNTNGPFDTSRGECISRRYWWTSMWGFIVTLVALTMDVWGAIKAVHDNTIFNIFATILGSALNPLIFLWDILERTIDGKAMQGNLREAFGDDIIGPMYPWSKSHIKIISGCDVIVNLSPNVHKENHNHNAFKVNESIDDLSEALVIGPKVLDSKQFNVLLTSNGKLALLRSNVLPPYDELKFLRGNSSLGMAIASVQATGYIYGIVVRCAQGLRVSPIEAIACVLNMVILMKGVLHNFSSSGHRPLLLYLQREEEAKFMEECKSVEGFEFKVRGRIKLGVSIICGVVLGAGLYFVVNFLKTLSIICVVPIILFQVSLVLGGIGGFVWTSNDSGNLGVWSIFPIALLNLVGYIWALVVTFKYWNGEDFDVQSSNFLSQVLPYIG